MYEILNPKKYITVVKIPLSNIEKVDMIMAKQPTETMSSCYNRLTEKPTFLINGSLYNMKDGATITTVVDEGKLIASGYGAMFGLSIYKDGTLKFEAYNSSANLKDYIGACPSLVVNGKISIDTRGLDNGFVNSRHPRTAIGMNNEYFYIIIADGRNPNQGYIGMTLNELATFALNELKCTNAMNLDGGGSTRLMYKDKVINHVTENRAVDNFLAFYIKKPKPLKVMKVNVASALNIRSAPSTSGNILGTYSNGMVVNVYEEKNGWAFTDDGWVSLSYLVPYTTVKKNGVTIVIDCGHDSVADNKNLGYSKKYKEHEGNWEYGHKLKKYLEEHGFTVIMTRPTNSTTLSLSERARVAIDNKALVFMSIHSDALPTNTSAGGTSVYYSINRPNDKSLAERIGKCIAKSYGINFRGALTRPSTTRAGFDYYTIIDVAANYKKLMDDNNLYEVPHVFLVERAFHSNPNEEKLLLDETISDKSAKELANEINLIFGNGEPKLEDDDIMIIDSLVCKKIINVNTALNVRELPNTNSKILGQLKNGDIVQVTGKANNWYRINYNGKDAFISGDYVKDYVEKDYSKEIQELKNEVSILKAKIKSAISALS